MLKKKPKKNTNMKIKNKQHKIAKIIFLVVPFDMKMLLLYLVECIVSE